MTLKTVLLLLCLTGCSKPSKFEQDMQAMHRLVGTNTIEVTFADAGEPVITNGYKSQSEGKTYVRDNSRDYGQFTYGTNLVNFPWLKVDSESVYSTTPGKDHNPRYDSERLMFRSIELEFTATVPPMVFQLSSGVWRIKINPDVTNTIHQ